VFPSTCQKLVVHKSVQKTIAKEYKRNTNFMLDIAHCLRCILIYMIFWKLAVLASSGDCFLYADRFFIVVFYFKIYCSGWDQRWDILNTKTLH
jgi:hypothetical protein